MAKRNSTRRPAAGRTRASAKGAPPAPAKPSLRERIQQQLGDTPIDDSLAAVTWMQRALAVVASDLVESELDDTRSAARCSRSLTAWRGSPIATASTRPNEIEDAVFAASLGTSWGVLGLIAHDGQSWFDPGVSIPAAPERRPRGLARTRRPWNTLLLGPVQGERLWSVPNNLHFVLANLGVPNDMLSAPLPPEGRRALFKHVRPVN